MLLFCINPRVKSFRFEYFCLFATKRQELQVVNTLKTTIKVDDEDSQLTSLLFLILKAFLIGVVVLKFIILESAVR